MITNYFNTRVLDKYYCSKIYISWPSNIVVLQFGYISSEDIIVRYFQVM